MAIWEIRFFQMRNQILDLTMRPNVQKMYSIWSSFYRILIKKSMIVRDGATKSHMNEKLSRSFTCPNEDCAVKGD
jgi:hypothetical protein